jgi:hypothetical protein
VAQEQGVQLQADTLAATGSPVRMIGSGVTVTVNGVPVQTAQQVVSVADANGAIIDKFFDNSTSQDILIELREMRKLLCLFMGVPYTSPALPETDQQNAGF